MRERKDLMTASVVDCTLLLMPMIGPAGARRMLVESGVSAPVIARVLERPAARRPIREATTEPAPPYFGQA